MDIYIITAIVLVILFLIPIVYLFFFIGSGTYLALKERYRKKIIKNDPILGEIEYYDGYWTALDYSVSIESTKDGPAEEQKQFYIFLKNELDGYVTMAKQYLAEQITEEDFSRHEMFSISIGTIEEIKNSMFSLQLSASDSDLIYDVRFEHNKPVSFLAGD